MEGTYNCPICGKASPHQHSGEEIVESRNGKRIPPDLNWSVGPTDYDGGRTFGKAYAGVFNEHGKQLAYIDPDIAKIIVTAHNASLTTVKDPA